MTQSSITLYGNLANLYRLFRTQFNLQPSYCNERYLILLFHEGDGKKGRYPGGLSA